ncbi:hypothetical protein HQO42_18900 [Rhodococcus fascians]|nr:hypothetical protein [Rhodococcus fascians]MBY4254726.1 hypothetical protein [Rhodococcus fascians]MBY4270040.1 hypothetical protein [Rhodococcus fascians]
MGPHHDIGHQIDELFPSAGSAGTIPTDLIPVLSKQIASHRDALRERGQTAQARRADTVLGQLARLYIDRTDTP